MNIEGYNHEPLACFFTQDRHRIDTHIFCHILELAHYEIQIDDIYMDSGWTGEADSDAPYVVAIGWEENNFYHDRIENVFSICRQLDLNLLSCNLEFFAADGKVRYCGADYLKDKIK